jgi:hypothetical protein
MKILDNGLPLFPLNTVLFPHARLPLHIFEPRYREMIARCIDDDLAFGVLLIKEGVEVGGPAIPHAVGTLAQITNLTRLPDGRMNLTALGVTRFRLLEQFDAHAYATGRIVLLPDEHVDETQAQPVAADVRRWFTEYVRAIRQVSEPDHDATAFNLPDDSTALSYIVAAVLPITALEKQMLLEIQTTHERLQRELNLLRREIELLKTMLEKLPRLPDQGLFSLN